MRWTTTGGQEVTFVDLCPNCLISTGGAHEINYDAPAAWQQDPTGTDETQRQLYCGVTEAEAITDNIRLAEQMRPVQRRAFLLANPEAQRWPNDILLVSGARWLQRLVIVREHSGRSYCPTEASWTRLHRVLKAKRVEGWLVQAYPFGHGGPYVMGAHPSIRSVAGG